MLSAHALLIYCSVFVVAVAVPGPAVIALVARALASGFRGSLPAVAGTMVGDWIVMTLSAFGLALLARALGGLFLVVKLAGAAYLFYLAWRYWTAKVGAEAGEAAEPSAGRSFFGQVGLILGNPKTLTFYVAVLPAVIDLHKLTLIGYAELSVVGLVLIPAVCLTYVGLSARVRGLLTSVRARRRINQTAAVVMTGAGIAVAAT